MKRYSLKIGILGMFCFVITVFVVIPYVCTKIDRILNFPCFTEDIYLLTGIILLVIGGALTLWCLILFIFIGKGTPVPLYPPKKFVIKGSYKYTRNPMMLGVWMILIGEALVLFSFSLIIFTIFIAIPSGALFVIKYEEKDLQERFGKEYLEYKDRVPRWLPGLKSKKCK